MRLQIRSRLRRVWIWQVYDSDADPLGALLLRLRCSLNPIRASVRLSEGIPRFRGQFTILAPLIVVAESSVEVAPLVIEPLGPNGSKQKRESIPEKGEQDVI